MSLGSAVEARLVRDPAEWARLRDSWDGVVTGAERPSPFATWDFLECSWLRFARPKGHALAVVALHEAGRLIGFAPFQLATRRKLGLPLRRLSLLASWEADRVPPLVHPPDRGAECAAAVIACLEEHGRDWDQLSLREVSPEDPLGLALEAWSGRGGRRLVPEPASPSPYALLEPGAEHGVKDLGSATRKSLRRYRRKLESAGPCGLEVFETPEHMEHALATYIDLEDRSWKRGEGQGVGKNESNHAFYTELLPRLARDGRAVVSFLMQGGVAVAGAIDLRLGEAAYGSHATYAESAAALSPGNVLNALLFEWHAAHGVRRYELYALFLGNKMRWASGTWENRHLDVYQTRGLRRSLLFAPGRLKAMLAKPKPGASGPGAHDAGDPTEPDER